jgi:hypothetical protein
MDWQKTSKHSIESANGYSISRATVEATDKFTLWGPPGSGAEQFGAIERNTAAALRDLFDITEATQSRQIARARLILGVFDSADDARAAAEGDACSP